MDKEKDTAAQDSENTQSGHELESNTQAEAMGDASEESKNQETTEDLLAREKDKFLRLFAEFENYKKRTGRERIELFKTAGQEVIAALLPVLDDFDRALKELSKDETDDRFTGVKLIHNKFREVLKGKGLEDIEVKAGDGFDAEVHEAITQIPAPDKKLVGKIVDVVEKGYTLGDKIIRHPKVVVGN
ncbi:MAG: hypothetical protein RLZZ241_1926 [Bacteroidota bacterium]|jgi:molecular chaperone GrpE